MLNIVGEYVRNFKVNFSRYKGQVIVVEGRKWVEINRWKLGELEIKRMDKYQYIGISVAVDGFDKAWGRKKDKSSSMVEKVGLPC